PVVIGLSSSSLLWFWLFDEQVGLLNKLMTDLRVIAEPMVWFVSADLAFWAVVISITWKVLGFGMVLFIASIQSIDREIMEAAVVDGAGYWIRVFRIVLPLSRRIILLTTLVSANRLDAGLRSVLHHDVRRATRADIYRRLLDLSELVRVVQTRLWRSAVDCADPHHSRLFDFANRVDGKERGEMTSAVLSPEAPAMVARRPRPQARAAYLIDAISIAVIAIMGAPIVLSALASVKTAADAS